jgi:flagellar hook-basal body complex protein FliE
MAKNVPTNPPRVAVRAFFARSDLIDHDVLRPLAHAKGTWEISWDCQTQRYEHEQDSFAKYLNVLIDDIADTAISAHYHDNEDVVANYLASKPESKIEKKAGRWIGASYGWILEQGGFDDIDQGELLTSAIGRVAAALERGQMTYDEMEQGHRLMLADVLTIILYHRSNYEPDDWSDV